MKKTVIEKDKIIIALSRLLKRDVLFCNLDSNNQGWAITDKGELVKVIFGTTQTSFEQALENEDVPDVPLDYTPYKITDSVERLFSTPAEKVDGNVEADAWVEFLYNPRNHRAIMRGDLEAIHAND